MEQLIQITAKHFCAGLIVTDGVVTFAAPIIKYMIDWRIERVRDYCKFKGWTMQGGLAVT